MADVNFTPKTWKDGSSGGTPITASELNRMEQGIKDCATACNDLGDSISQSDVSSLILATGSDVTITSKTAKKVGDIVFAQVNFTFKAAASPNNIYEVADMGGIGTLATRGLGSYLNGSAWVSGDGTATVSPVINVKAGNEQYAQFVFMTM